MRASAHLSLRLGDEREARRLFEALRLEAKSDSRLRSKVAARGREVSIDIVAGDRAALRSAVNSYGRWIRLYEEIGGLK